MTAPHTLDDAAKLRAMLDLGIPYPAACRAAGITVKAAERLVPRHEPGRPISEAEEQRRITRDVLASGGAVWSTSSVRRSKIAVGFPDLWITVGGVGLFWETKVLGGIRSPEQARFALGCQQSGTPYCWGTHADFIDYCRASGITLTALATP